MKVDFFNGKYKEVYSNSVVLVDDAEGIQINFEGGREYNIHFSIIMNFIDGAKDADDAKMEIYQMDDGTVILTIKNADNPFGIGNKYPMPFTTQTGNEKIFFKFRFSRPSNDMTRLLTYSFFVER